MARVAPSDSNILLRFYDDLGGSCLPPKPVLEGWGGGTAVGGGKLLKLKHLLCAIHLKKPLNVTQY